MVRTNLLLVVGLAAGVVGTLTAPAAAAARRPAPRPCGIMNVNSGLVHTYFNQYRVWVLHGSIQCATARHTLFEWRHSVGTDAPGAWSCLDNQAAMREHVLDAGSPDSRSRLCRPRHRRPGGGHASRDARYCGGVGSTNDYVWVLDGPISCGTAVGIDTELNDLASPYIDDDWRWHCTNSYDPSFDAFECPN